MIAAGDTGTGVDGIKPPVVRQYIDPRILERMTFGDRLFDFFLYPILLFFNGELLFPGKALGNGIETVRIDHRFFLLAVQQLDHDLDRIRSRRQTKFYTGMFSSKGNRYDLAFCRCAGQQFFRCGGDWIEGDIRQFQTGTGSKTHSGELTVGHHVAGEQPPPLVALLHEQSQIDVFFHIPGGQFEVVPFADLEQWFCKIPLVQGNDPAVSKSVNPATVDRGMSVGIKDKACDREGGFQLCAVFVQFLIMQPQGMVLLLSGEFCPIGQRVFFGLLILFQQDRLCREDGGLFRVFCSREQAAGRKGDCRLERG